MPQAHFLEKWFEHWSQPRGVSNTLRMITPQAKFNKNRLLSPFSCLIKRSFDMFFSAMALLILAPVLFFIAGLVRCDGGPALFKQERIGKGGIIFYCYKFRSMCPRADTILAYYLFCNPEKATEWQTFQKLKNDFRITPVGSFIRRWHIDELPQLINVLKGDMSLVGPRPIIVDQEDYYGDDFEYYRSVRPGITGPWQVGGRNTVTFEERIVLECDYARNWSLWMDIVILLKTLPTLLQKEQAF